MGYYNDFSELKGRQIVLVSGLEVDSEEVAFVCADGSRWRMFHSQDCCESVSIAEVIGDPSDAIGLVVDAREETSEADPAGYVNNDDWRESFTWTFFVLQTERGALTIRWLGQSNGWYSERAEFQRIDQ
jgi:hypothetical protein